MTSANGSATGQPTAIPADVAASIAALPTPLPPRLLTEIDTDAQSKAVLSHLNDVIRFYRLSVAPLQRVGEPSDASYAQQAQARAVEVGRLAFQTARGQAAFLARVIASQRIAGMKSDNSRTAVITRETAKRLADLQLQESALASSSRKGESATATALSAKRADIDGQIKVDKALFNALSKLSTGPDAEQTELQGNIDRLQHSVPELIDDKQKLVTPTIESLGTVGEKGVATQATLLFQLVSTEAAINDEIGDVDGLSQKAAFLRAPLVRVLRATLAASSDLQNETATNVDGLARKSKEYNQLADTFSALSDVAVPLSQEILTLEQTKANLVSWRGSIAAERKLILRSLLLRLLCIAGALTVIFAVGEIWRRYVNRYVQDIRRRRHILVIRRMVTGFLTLVVLTVGFVTQFSSVATFAGFISAGIAVGLQTILLSVAAYFFIVGRFGVKVGDRITVSGVTGDVVNVSLVRFYVLELAGAGELHPTGRIAVFANSVLFQTGTPLYKQIPGTEYVWHQLTFKLKSGVDYEPLAVRLRQAVDQVFKTYSEKLKAQHENTSSWMDVPLEAPQIESHLQMTNGPEYAVLYPVEISEASRVDEEVIKVVMLALSERPDLEQIVDGLPTIKTIIKGTSS